VLECLQEERVDNCAPFRCPDTAKVRTKMIFASSKDELKKRLVGVACEIQGSDAGDVALETVVDRLQQI